MKTPVSSTKLEVPATINSAGLLSIEGWTKLFGFQAAGTVLRSNGGVPTWGALTLGDLPFTGIPSSTTFSRGDGTWSNTLTGNVNAPRFRFGTDDNHSLYYSGAVDGPVLQGYGGVALATGIAGENVAGLFTSTGLAVTGNITPSGNVIFANNNGFNFGGTTVAENYGVRFTGPDGIHPVQVFGTSLLVGTAAAGANYGTNNLYVAGNSSLATALVTGTSGISRSFEVRDSNGINRFSVDGDIAYVPYHAQIGNLRCTSFSPNGILNITNNPWVNSIGMNKGINLQPTDSTTGTGGGSAMVVNWTGTGTGTGPKYLYQGQKTGVDKWWVNTDAVHFIANAGGTPSVPIGGGKDYVLAGARMYIGSSGTITQMAPA